MSRIRTNLITNRMANGAPTVSNGLVISGVTTVTTLDLNGDLDVDGHLNADNVSIAGVATATTFVGNLTGTASQVTIANGANNRILTAASSNTINAESNVLYDGTNFGIGKSPSRTLDVQGKIRSSDSVCFGDNSSTPSEGAAIHRPANSALAFVTNNAERLRITSGGSIGIATHSPSSAWVDIASDSGSYDHLRMRRLSSDSNVASNWSMKPYGGNLYFRTGGSTDKIYFDDSGDLNIMDGNLIMGTSGHGIDFAATSDASGNTSELLDEYEEGTWNPLWSDAMSGGTTTSNNMFGSYVRIGRIVHAHFFTWGLPVQGTSNNMYLQGLPFAMANVNSMNAIFAPVQAAYYGFGADNYYSLGLRLTNGNTAAPLKFSRVNNGDQVSASFSGFINYYTNFYGCLTYNAV